MPRRRAAETIERDHRAYDLFRRGLSYRQIAAELKVSHQTAFDAVRRAVKDNAADPVAQADARQASLDRLQDYRRAAQRVLASRHHMVSQGGKIVYGPSPDGSAALPLTDHAPVLAALRELLRIEQEENRLRDVYPPARSRVEVIDDDVARMLAEEAEREIARITADDPGHGVTGERGPAR